MKFFVNLLLILSVMFAPLQPAFPVMSDIVKSRNTNTNDENTEEVTDGDTEVTDDTNVIEYKAKNFLDLDLEGYGTIRMPQSHFTLNTNTSNNVEKNLLYRDNKSKIKISYITNISDGTDIPGYITREVAGVDTVTNDKEEIVINNRTWMKVHSTTKEENNDVYVWYSLSKNNDTAVWLKASVYEDSNDAEWDSVLQQMLATFTIYYVNGTLFETPDTGYYLGKDFNNGTEGDSTKYGANDKANSVFQSRGGYVPDANISPDWKDMQIIIDGVRIQIPCSLQVFYNAGYKINSYKYSDDYLINKGDSIEDVEVINKNGTVLTLEILNNSKSEQAQLSTCPVVSLTVDKSKFLSKEEMAENNKTIEKSREDLQAKEQKMYEKQLAGEYEEEEYQVVVERKMSSPCVVVTAYTAYVVDKMEENFHPTDNADWILFTAYEGDNLELVRKVDDQWYEVKVNEEVQGYINAGAVTAYETAIGEEPTLAKAEETEEKSDTTTKDNEVTQKANDNSNIEDKSTNNEESTIKKGNLDTEAVVVNTFEHEMILAGGVTWDVYYDDLVNYYEKVGFTKIQAGSQSYKCSWVEQNKSMIIEIGMLKGINKITMSVYKK